MINANRVSLKGNLTREIETRYTPTGKPVAKFGLAINEGSKEKPSVIFVDVEAWNGTAEFAVRNLKKGSPVHIDGRLKFETWEDKETKSKRTKLLVVAESIDPLTFARREEMPTETATK
jgi:single stranded DNA-binding protein